MKARGIVVVLGALLLLGCRAGGGRPDGRRIHLTVDFETGRTLRYKFVSHRDITLDWDAGAADSDERVQEQSEHFEMVVAYTPVEVDPYGASTLRAVCESVSMKRTGRPSGRGLTDDAVLKARGQSFTVAVDPRGRIVDGSDLDRLIGELGAAAFRADTTRGRIKEPDLVGDFIAGTWFLWDPVAGIDTPIAGVTVGQTWPSKLPVPTPMVMRTARNVTYRLDDVRQGEEGLVAEIGGTYSLAESAPQDWPVPYSGRFQLSGTFGFLGAYEIVSLEGRGRTLFDVDAGRLESRQQHYTLQMKASLPPMGIRANPLITIEQTLTMALLAEQ